MNAAPRNSAIRKNRSLANEVSMITIATPHSASLPTSTGMASSAPGRLAALPSPQGSTNTFMKIADIRNSFIQLPHLTSAYPRPEYSRTRLSSIIEISVDPPGLSIGIRPFSTRTIMKNATRPSRWVGSTTTYGDDATAWFIRYGLSEADTAPTVKNTRISAGSAMLPIQLARLGPSPPQGVGG